MLVKNRTIPIVAIALLLASMLTIFMTADERYVAIPGFACVIVVLWLLMKLWDRDRKFPFIDIGVFCAVGTLVYAVFPLINYWADGLQFGILADYRLQMYHITSEELGIFHLRHFLYLFSFVIVYALFRGKGSLKLGNVRAPSRSISWIIITVFCLLSGYFLILQLFSGVNFNTSYEPEAYSKNLAAIASLPLLLVQISSKLGGLLFLFKLALLFVVVRKSKKRNWQIILFIWIFLETIQALIIMGGRTGYILFLMATALFYHRMVKPLKFKFLVFAGVSLLFLFILLGLYRSYFDVEEMQADLGRSNAGILSSSNEFQSLLGTSYDVLQRKEAGADLPWYLYINDVVAILPPQQIIPVSKVAASEWYLREIGLDDTGQGFMWGVISQSVVGADWYELAIRGAILGYILALFHRWYLKHQTGFLETILYVFFCITIYCTFRNTTFSFLTNIVWQVLPFLLILRLFSGQRLFQYNTDLDRKVAVSTSNI